MGSVEGRRVERHLVMSDQSNSTASACQDLAAVPVDTRLDLIESRAETWARRADKWHRALNRERAWLWLGAAAPAAVAAACALGTSVHWGYAAEASSVGAVITALISVRAHAARSRLDLGKIEQAWVCADRVAEHYRGLLARFGRNDPGDLLSCSQKLEAAARFGVPASLSEVLRETSR